MKFAQIIFCGIYKHTIATHLNSAVYSCAKFEENAHSKETPFLCLKVFNMAHGVMGAHVDVFELKIK